MKVQIMPYRGRNEIVTEGKKTLVSLTDNYLFYKINYKHKAIVERTIGDEEIEVPFYEEGFTTKESVSAITRIIENDIKATDDEGNDIEVDIKEVPVISVSSLKEAIHFSCNSMKEADKLYKALIEWKFNINPSKEDDDNTI